MSSASAGDWEHHKDKMLMENPFLCRTPSSTTVNMQGERIEVYTATIFLIILQTLVILIIWQSKSVNLPTKERYFRSELLLRSIGISIEGITDFIHHFVTYIGLS